MEIKKAEIRYLKKSGLVSDTAEGLRHVKVLPYLSVVQSVEGSYDITLGKGETVQTGDGGFFVAPSGVQQTIVHHVNKKSGRIVCRWIFIDVEINKSYRIDEIYQFPTLLDKDTEREMNSLFDTLFSTEDFFEEQSCCYRILGLLVRGARPLRQRANHGIYRAVDYMMENFERPISIKELAGVANMSESNFYAAFRRQFGSSPMAYLNHYRLSIAAERMISTGDTVSEIGYSVGITDPLYFSKLFKKTYGMTPREYRASYERKI